MYIEKFKLDTIISKRNQFGDLRYQVISESLVYEQSKLIGQADSIIKENYEAFNILNYQQQKTKENNQNYILAALTQLTSTISQFQYFFIVDNSTIFEQKEKNKSVLQYQAIEKMISENLGQSQAPQQQSVQQQRNRIVIEITMDVFEQQAKLSPKQIQEKNQLFINHLRDRINVEQEQFWNQSDRLVEQYKNQFESKEYLKNQGQCQSSVSVLVINKKFSNSDYQLYLENSYIIENGELQQCDSNYNGSSKVINPYQEYNQIYANKNMLSCISQLQKCPSQSSYDQIRSILIGYFGQLNDLSTFKQLLEVLEYCRQIILWDTLLKRFIYQASTIGSLTQTKIIRKYKQNVSQLQFLLDQSYSSLQPRFRDAFYNFADQNQITEYLNQPICNCESTDGGHCAYEILPDGILLYFKMAIQVQLKIKIAYSCCSLLHYSKDKLLKETGELAQLILADKEDGKQVLKCNFTLKDHSRSQVLQQLTQQDTNQLMIDILIRIVSVRMKQQVFNPVSRASIIESQKQQKPIMLEI